MGGWLRLSVLCFVCLTNPMVQASETPRALSPKFTWTKMMAAERGEIDGRGNVAAYTVHESQWAVRVLVNSYLPVRLFAPKDHFHELRNAHGRVVWNPRSDNLRSLFLQHLILMKDAGLAIDRDMLWEHYHDFRPLERSSYARKDGFWPFMFSPDAGLREALEAYQNTMLEHKCAPAGVKDTHHMPKCVDRMKKLRGSWFFQHGKGREKESRLARKISGRNQDAGIATRMNQPLIGRCFFGKYTLVHGKNLFRHNDGAPIAREMERLCAPFIAGPSGSVGDAILFIEDTGPDNMYPHGLIPSSNPHAREALIGMWSALVIAGGHHSLVEALLAAKGLDYLQGTALPDTLPLGTEAPLPSPDDLPSDRFCLSYEQMANEMVEELSHSGVEGRHFHRLGYFHESDTWCGLTERQIKI